MAKEAKVTEEQVVKAPPIQWNQTVNSGWYISNEVFRRTAHTGEFLPKNKPAAKPAEHKPAPSAA